MSAWVDLAYLLAASLFILGIKGLTRPRTAVRGNVLSALGMLIAIVVTLLDQRIITFEYIIAAVIIGTIIGAFVALKVQMTAVPQMVALLNGFGGGASLTVAASSYLGALAGDGIATMDTVSALATTLATLIGAVTLTGSVVAFAKLQGIVDKVPLPGKAVSALNALLFTGAILCLLAVTVDHEQVQLFYVLAVLALVLGIFLVIPIGGADMPVVIALLNSYSGIAAAFAGFIMNNTVLIVSGSLVGASGLILTRIMCDAMNRSLFNVLFGVMGEAGEVMDADEVYEGKVKSSSPEEVAMILESAERVVIVPGFGMAMAQAQHAVRELSDALQQRGCEVLYGIHPVAGRMPGHMNVLLAEAEVPYEQLVEMERINPTFEQTDVVIVIGANDVTNPLAREDKGSPIYGMPILNVDKARTVVVVKRSLSPGFAGLPNPLFAMDNTLMLFGDGKKAIVELTEAVMELD